MGEETAATIDRFATSLADLDVPFTRTSPDAFEPVLADIVREPAIGVSLPFDDVTLPEVVDDAPTPATLEAATTGVTAATLAIADYGSVVVPSTPDGAEPVSLVPELHVAVLDESDLVADVPTAIECLGPRLRDGESAIVATGPSATADMGALVKGAHGPREVHVVLLEREDDRDGPESSNDRTDGESGD